MRKLSNKILSMVLVGMMFITSMPLNVYAVELSEVTGNEIDAEICGEISVEEPVLEEDVVEEETTINSAIIETETVSAEPAKLASFSDD